MERRILSLRTLILGNALVLALVYALHALFPTALLGFELKTLDSRFQARQALGLAPAFSEQLVHINIDSYSKDQSGDSLWEKKVYAKLIQEIAKGGPEAIACDIMFVQWADQADNASVVDAAIEAGNLVSPFLFSETAGAASQPPPQAMGLTINPRLAPGSARHATGVLVGPIEDLMEHSAGLGFVNLSPDADGVIRRVPVVVEMSGALVPSFFLQALAIQLDYDLENISLVDHSHIILRDFPAGSSGPPRDLPLPLDEDGNLIVNFSGPLSLKNYPHSYSAWDLLKKTPARPDFSGKLVFLADTSPQNSQYGDISPIPLDNAFPRAYIWSNA
ncbi:MAG: CHASE2 domain-containing protein, partial [Arenicellales bacterium]|nr:CHASE2 domain-containing protein [Arenicellales bacterium]